MERTTAIAASKLSIASSEFCPLHGATPLASSSHTLVKRGSHQRVHSPDVVAWIDEQGFECFNFSQQIWLYPGVCMHNSAVWSKEAHVLALNILVRARKACELRVSHQSARDQVEPLVRDFAECLQPVAGTNWQMPHEAIICWLRERSPEMLQEARRPSIAVCAQAHSSVRHVLTHRADDTPRCERNAYRVSTRAAPTAARKKRGARCAVDA